MKKPRRDQRTMNMNKAIGYRLHLIRISQRLSRKKVCCVFGCSQQQLYKYEKGKDAIMASRLFILLRDCYKIDVAVFFSSLSKILILIENSNEQDLDEAIFSAKELRKLVGYEEHTRKIKEILGE